MLVPDFWDYHILNITSWMSENSKCLPGGYVFGGETNIYPNLNTKWILDCHSSPALALALGKIIVYVFFPDTQNEESIYLNLVANITFVFLTYLDNVYRVIGFSSTGKKLAMKSF